MAKACIQIYINNKQIMCHGGNKPEIRSMTKYYRNCSFTDFRKRFPFVTYMDYLNKKVYGVGEPKKRNIEEKMVIEIQNTLRLLGYTNENSDFELITDNLVNRLVQSNMSTQKFVRCMKFDKTFV